MERKRRVPARAAAREEASNKKRATPELVKVATPEALPPAPPPQPKPEPLPTSYIPGRPLPTLDKPFLAPLLPAQWQTIAESGIMAESLERSRKKWLSEGLFQKYWSKPTKKKGVLYEEPGNPSRDTMVRAGTCAIIIEPHVFEVNLYTIKDTTAKPPFQPPPPPMYRPIIQYGPPGGVMPPPPTPPMPNTHLHQGPATPSRPTNGSSPAAYPTAPQQNGGALPPQARPSPGPPPQSPYQGSHPPPSPAPASKSSDPVIQLLAERAATDPALKALMRIVAAGEATPDQLKSFQGHIDELTKVLQQRNAANASPAPTAAPPPNIVRQAPPPQAQPPRPQHGQNHYYPPPQQQQQALRSRGPPQPPRFDISAVVFDFIGGSGDRFIFPKHSILEKITDCRLICSFLIVRKGTPDDSKYDPKLDYYQPISIRIEAKPEQPRLLDNLYRVVAPPDEVRRYMNEIMDNMTRAEYVLLAMQLPREVEQQPLVDEDVAMKDSPDNNGVLWTSIEGPPQAKSGKTISTPISEEQAYQDYIKSVS